MQDPGYGAAITLAAAKRVLAAAEREAVANGCSMVIVILDSSGLPVLLQRMDGVTLGSLDVAQAKAQTAVRFRRATKTYQDRIAAGGAELRLLTMPGICAIEGGLPLIENGRLVGAIGVSGATAAQDGQVAAAGAGALQA